MTKTEKRIKFFEKFSELTEFAKKSNIHFLVTCYNALRRNRTSCTTRIKVSAMDTRIGLHIRIG